MQHLRWNLSLLVSFSCSLITYLLSDQNRKQATLIRELSLLIQKWQIFLLLCSGFVRHLWIQFHVPSFQYTFRRHPKEDVSMCLCVPPPSVTLRTSVELLWFNRMEIFVFIYGLCKSIATSLLILLLYTVDFISFKCSQLNNIIKVYIVFIIVCCLQYNLYSSSIFLLLCLFENKEIFILRIFLPFKFPFSNK